MLRTTLGPIFIIACLATQAVGCSLTSEVRPDFDSALPQDRLAAAAEARRSSDPKAIEPLIRMLSSDDPLMRLVASDTLTKITGEDFGYDPGASDAERREAALRWSVWHSENQDQSTGRARL